jgi:hypothetical protein
VVDPLARDEPYRGVEQSLAPTRLERPVGSRLSLLRVDPANPSPSRP